MHIDHRPLGAVLLFQDFSHICMPSSSLIGTGENVPLGSQREDRPKSRVRRRPWLHFCAVQGIDMYNIQREINPYFKV